MSAPVISLQVIRQHPAVAYARIRKGLVDVHLRGKLGFRGEQNSRVSIHRDQIVITRAAGDTSEEWESNLMSLVEWLGQRGIECRHVHTSEYSL